MNLGGRNFDDELIKHCIEEFNKTAGIDLTNNKQAQKRLYIECERAKHTLSEFFEAEVRVSSIAEDEDLVVKITRDELENKIAELLEKLADPLDKALEDA